MHLRLTGRRRQEDSSQPLLAIMFVVSHRSLFTVDRSLSAREAATDGNEKSERISENVSFQHKWTYFRKLSFIHHHVHGGYYFAMLSLR